MPAPEIVETLVERFGENRKSYQSPQFNETQLRREFLDPLFTALGWDVANKDGHAEAYKDVIHEDAIKVGGATKAPDYCFRVGGRRVFFLEAKKPSVNVKDDVSAAYQLRRYAWSAKLPLSILTDFEELALYDCRVKPDKADKSSVGRILFVTFDEYLERWDELASIFSKQAVLKGSFDRYAESTKLKRGTAEVDAAFLQEIESWRDSLARNFARRNDDLSQRDLNFAVQRTIDRIIFLRMCEDRGVEQYGQLQGLTNGDNVYRRLCQLFDRADERYNSGLFHFQPEKGCAEPPDELTQSLELDDKPLKEILRGLYYPDSPYEFSVLAAEILGQVYEQFLGKVIRLTAGHQAKIEDKPEVKKAGGVYYTPAYIVEYIVRSTVGKLLEGKSPKEVGKLSVLDPACGSGSFLVGAYQFLLDWHRDWYLDDGAGKHKKQIYQGRGGQWFLTTAEKKRILLNNIYGVDIDSQAVEVTKLSLLLKVLENESSENIENQLRLLHERALPDLGDNIKCGNSLIGPDFYNGQQMSLLDEDEQYRINVFDWKTEFPAIFKGKGGGFDAVIGNPPYIRIQTMRETAPQTIDYYKQHYAAASKGNYDIYVLFVERGLYLLNGSGRLGLILPHKFFNAKYGQSLRKLAADGQHLAHVVHFTDQQVFHGATTYTCLMFLTKSPNKAVDFLRVKDLTGWRTTALAERAAVPAGRFTDDDWNIEIGPHSDVLARLSRWPVKLGDIADRMAQGIRTSANEIYVLDIVNDAGSVITARSKQLDAEVKLERGSVLPFLQGREIKSYRIQHSGKVVIIPYHPVDSRTILIPEMEYSKRFPKTYAYLQDNKTVLERRENGRMRGSDWYGFVYPKNIDVMKSPKILVPDIADRAAFALDERGQYAFTSGYGITFLPGISESPKYFVGLLNSRVLDFYLKGISTTLRGGFFRYFTQYIAQLPIRTIDPNDRTDRALHDRMVTLVEQMTSLHLRLSKHNTAHERTGTERQIDATDRQIDHLVYELYGLTDAEIRLVEQATER